jgi:hypothetical protein
LEVFGLFQIASVSGLFCGQIFPELVELPEAELGGLPMMAGRGFGHCGIVNQPGLTEDFRRQTMLASRPPGMCGGLPIAFQLVEASQRVLIPDLLDRPPGRRQGRVRRTELALIEGEDGGACGAVRFSGARPGFDGLVISAAAGEPFREAAVATLGVRDVPGTAEEPRSLAEVVAARSPHHLRRFRLATEFKGDSSRLVPLLALAVEREGASLVTFLLSHLSRADEIASAHQSSLQPLLGASCEQELRQRPYDECA